MRIILHIEAHQAEFRTDKAGDLHIFARGLEPDLKPLPRKRGRKPKNVPAAGVPVNAGVPYHEPALEDKDGMKTIVMNDEGWT